MKRLLTVCALLAAFMLPAYAQSSGRLPADDQKEFDKYYTKWINDTRKNDRDDIAKDVHHMQEIMGRNGIPANVPFEQVASTGNAYPSRSYQNRLAGEDQKEFDKYYTKWVKDTRKNDQDDVARDVRHMQDIMARNNIPPNVPFDQVASTGYAGGGYADNGYAGNAGPATAYPANGSWQGRLSPDDQRDFDRYYSRWVEDTRNNDRDAIAADAGRLQEIMARNNIPSNVPFDQIASSANYPNNGYAGRDYPDRAYPPSGQARLSADDQHEFDKYYSKWVNDTRKNDRDDVERDTRHMQDVMARYNIPANVPYDQIASPDAASRH
jgi:hypothetical protein